MAPNKWDEEDSEEESSDANSPAPVARRTKFDDEEDEEEVLEDWEAAEDSEVERAKAKKAAEEQAKAEAAAKASHKSKTQRIAEKQAESARRRQAELDESSDEEEDEAERRARLQAEQKHADLKHAEDLFADLQVTNNRKAAKPVTLADPNDAANTIDLSSLPIFNPTTKDQFNTLKETLTPLLTRNAKKAQYTIFMQDFAKQMCKELPSDQIKKIASALTALSNEKLKEEKAAEKGGKKTKAQKTKTTLSADRGIGSKNYADTAEYDGNDGGDDDDFM